MWKALWLVASALALCACGGGSQADPDARPVDGEAPPDAPDAFDPCPGRFPFEALVTDVATGDPIASALVEGNGDGGGATSAPNGRAVLCLEESDADLRLSREGYLTTRYPLDIEAARRHLGTGPFPAPMLGDGDADSLVADLGSIRDPEDAMVLVEVFAYPGGEPALGAAATLDSAGHEGPFVEDAEGGWVAGATLAHGSRMLFVNVAVGAGSTPVGATRAPGGASCLGSAALPLEGGTLSYTFFACE